VDRRDRCLNQSFANYYYGALPSGAGAAPPSGAGVAGVSGVGAALSAGGAGFFSAQPYNEMDIAAAITKLINFFITSS
jgi:hypothetical protein